MKKGDILFGTVIYSVYMLVSCIVMMFAEMLAIKIINLFVGLSPLSLCIVRAIIYTVGVNAILAIVSYREGYRSASFSVVGTLISGALASMLDLGQGSGPMNHAFDLNGKYAEEKCNEID